MQREASNGKDDTTMRTTTTFLNPTAASFDDDVLRSDEPVLVEFWAPWCGPCNAFKPVVERVAKERGQRVAFVNVDEEPALARRYGVQSIPAIKLFRGGQVVAENVGAQAKGQLEAWLDSHGA